MDLIKELLGNWKFAVGQRYELLSVLKDSDLAFTPQGSEKFKDLQYQFACIGSTEKAYTEMIKNGLKFDVSLFSKIKDDLVKLHTTTELKTKLEEIDRGFEDTIKNFSGDEVFDWGDTTSPVWRLITVLQEHERLHHGQLITYFTLADIEFPDNFKKMWNL